MQQWIEIWHACTCTQKKNRKDDYMKMMNIKNTVCNSKLKLWTWTSFSFNYISDALSFTQTEAVTTLLCPPTSPLTKEDQEITTDSRLLDLSPRRSQSLSSSHSCDTGILTVEFRGGHVCTAVNYEGENGRNQVCCKVSVSLFNILIHVHVLSSHPYTNVQNCQ